MELIDVKPGQKVLIIGAGTGMDIDYMPPGCEIIATDITPAMLKLTKKRNKKLKHNIKAMLMDGQNLEFPENTFDKVLLHMILTVIPDPVKTIQEAERVVKKGGKISVLDKFVPKNKKPSAVRKFFNLFTNVLFSNIAMNFEPLLNTTKLKVISDQKVENRGNYRIIMLEK
jgi:ubiquinone/menaquinone biosynthesis C-methylase UbiE